MVPDRVPPIHLGFAAGIIQAAWILVLSALAAVGMYTSVADQVSQWLIVYDRTLTGALAGSVEAFVAAFLWGAALAAVYNLIQERSTTSP